MSVPTPSNSWVPVPTFNYTSDPSRRSPDLYDLCCRQFAVETDIRYQRGHDPTQPKQTYCNIYLWDCTRALGCEIPHWVYLDGRPAPMGHGNRELSANGTCEWLRVYGSTYGWQPADMLMVLTHVREGKPAVVTFENPGGTGHVAMVLPTAITPPPHIAQAGASNFYDKPVGYGFGINPVKYYIHD